MRVAFLRGAGVALGPPTRDEHEALAELPFALATAALPRRTGVDRVLSFAARDPAGALLGGVSLEDVDWPQRRARVVARAHVDAEARWAAEALALARRYAFDELALDALDAQPRAEGWRRALADAGFRAVGEDLFTLATATPFPARRPA